MVKLYLTGENAVRAGMRRLDVFWAPFERGMAARVTASEGR